MWSGIKKNLYGAIFGMQKQSNNRSKCDKNPLYRLHNALLLLTTIKHDYCAAFNATGKPKNHGNGLFGQWHKPHGHNHNHPACEQKHIQKQSQQTKSRQ